MTYTIKALNIILLIFISIYGNVVFAQKEKVINIQIERSIASYFNTEGSEIFENATYKNRAFTFSIAISVNQNGVIDTILFSNKTPMLDSIVSFKRITEMLKSKKIMAVFSNHKNTVLLSTILLRKSWEYRIENVEEFDSYFNKLIPNLDAIGRLKKIKVLPAITMIQVRKQY